MNLAYFIVLKDKRYTSVLDKVLVQANTWAKMGHTTRVFLLGTCPSPDPIITAFESFDELLSSLDTFAPDIVYHRYWLMSGNIKKLLKKYPLVAEINTDTEQELKLDAKHSLTNLFRYAYYKFTNKLYLSYLKGIVSVTQELAPHSFESKTIVVPNSIEVNKFPYRKTLSNSNTTKLLFIGTPGLSWHGEDILVEIAGKLGEKFEIHVVGIDKPNNQTHHTNIFYYGFLHQSDYADLAKKCHIGIGTLALFRKEMSEACPLKVREYLAAGFPVILPYKDTAFLKEQPDWILSLDQNKIINLTQHIDEISESCAEFSAKNRDTIVPQQEVIPFIDTSILEAKRLNFFQSLTTKR